MITGEIKSKVDRIWDTMWSGGISIQAACALRCLARHYGVTKRDLLEKLLLDEQTRLVDTMDSDDVSDAYFGVTR